MSLHLKKLSALSLSCPKHTRFNGADIGSVKGGCVYCTELVSIFQQRVNHLARIAQFEELKKEAR